MGGCQVWDSGRVESSDQSYVSYAGPELAPGTSYSWTVRTWDHSGKVSPWASSASFDTGLSDRDWQANWIRRTTADRDDYTLARKDFTVGASPVVRARAYIAASQSYELHLNGKVVDRGGAFSYPGEGYYRAVDVTDQLGAGKPATVGVLFHWYGSGQGRPAGVPGLLLRLVVDHQDGTRQTVVTDGGWQVARGPWTTTPRRNGDAGDFVEDYDATAEPLGWDRPGGGAKDSVVTWQPAQVIGTHPVAPFTHLMAQRTGLTFTDATPVAVKRLPSGTLVADFGRVIPAVPVVRFGTGRSGQHIVLQAGYALAPDGAVSPAKADNQDTDLSFGYTQRDGDQVFRAFTYIGFRYLQVTDPSGDTRPADISAVIQHTDVDLDCTAQVNTSSPGVNASYDLMRRSALYDSQMQFLDTPTREKGQFLGDSVDVSLATMSGYAERRLTRQAIEEFIASQARFWPDGRLNAVYPNGDGKRDIPDYTEMFPGWVWDYYLQSGDRGVLADAYPVMSAVADYVRRFVDADTGLVTRLDGGTGDYHLGIIDWPMNMRFGYDMATTAHTTVNILATEVLGATARAADILGRDEDATALRADAEGLSAAINARLRRPDGVYIDGLNADGSQSTHAAQIANAYALAYQVAPESAWNTVGAHIASLGMRMGPMTAHRLLTALTLAGRTKDVVTRLTDASAPGWANILARGGTFTWESWGAPETGQSLSHGWGATALVDVQQTLLGVTVTEPGASAVRIAPPAAGLDWAKGQVPTQRGDIAVDWQIHGKSRTLSVDVPMSPPRWWFRRIR